MTSADDVTALVARVFGEAGLAYAIIFSELPEELYRAEEIVSRLRGLTAHVEPMVRFSALSAVYPFLSLAEPATRALLTKLLQDENDGVRKAAEAAVARLSSS